LLILLSQEKAETITAADEVDKIDSEHVDYKISTKGFIDDIDEEPELLYQKGRGKRSNK
jgi:hypothetical protein